MVRPDALQFNMWLAECGHPPIAHYGKNASTQGLTLMVARDVGAYADISSLGDSEKPDWIGLGTSVADLELWPCRSVPTGPELRSARRHKNGTAIIAPGFHPRSHDFGDHNHDKERPGFRQVGSIGTHRDGDGDSLAEWSRHSKLWTNARGVNIHDLRKGSLAGCIGMSQEDLDQLLRLAHALVAAGGGRPFNLLLIEPMLQVAA